MGNLSALFFLCISFLVPLSSRILRSDRTLLMIAWGSLVVRHCAALMNAFVTPLSTSWGDLYRFHNIGAGTYYEPGQTYGEFLGVIYHFFGVSFWLGEVCSIVVYSLSLVIFVEVAQLVGAGSRLGSCMLLYGFLPSPVIHCSVTLRESYQCLGFIGTVYGILCLRAKSDKNWWAYLLISVPCLILFHQGLLLYAAAAMLIGIPWAMQSRGQYSALVGVILLSTMPMLLPKAILSLGGDSQTGRAIQEGRFLEYASNYRNLVDRARSDYGVKIDSGDLVSFVVTTAVVLLMYFIAPLPWQASSVLDFYAFFEVVLRLALIFGMMQRIISSQAEERSRLIALASLTLGLEMMWAIATTNWGTSLRHHVVAFGGLVLLGAPYYRYITLDPELAALERRRERRRARQQ